MRDIDNNFEMNENESLNGGQMEQKDDFVSMEQDAAAEALTVDAEAVETDKAETEESEGVGNPSIEESYENVKADEYQKLRDKAARKAEKKINKHNKKSGKKKGSRVILKAASVILCAVLFGGISAGTFLGIIHATGYDDKLEAAIEAADKDNTAHINSVSLSDSVSANTSVSDMEDVAEIFENTIPSVVSITSKIIYESQGFGFFFNGGTYESTGAGSGIIIAENDSEILIVTNYHVIDGASSLIISFADGEEAPAIVKGTSEEDDLAVVAVNLSDISESTLSSISKATIGDSDSLRVGDKVIAIGNALGYGQSLTVGYVSALSRDVTINGITRNLLQTDAAINPGNSGGALLNSRGELIGINSAKYSDTNVEGVGFAIPISSVKELIEELMNKEPRVEVDESQASFLGITPANVDSSSAYMYNMPEGVYIYALSAGGPAEQSGLQIRDIITKIDGTKISSDEELRNMLKYFAGGTTVDITVQRIVDGAYQEMTIPVTLGFKSDYENNAASAIR